MTLAEAFPLAKNNSLGSRYEVIGEIIAQRFKVKLKCLVCNEMVNGLPSSIFTGRLPCNCSKNNSGKSTEKKLARILPIVESKGIKLLTSNIGRAKEPIPAVCKVCGHNWNTSYNSLFFKNHGCPQCSNNIRPSKSEFEDQIIALCESLDLGFISSNFSDDLKLAHVRVELECPRCSLLWKTSKGSLAKKSSCPRCAVSGFNSGAPAYLYILRVCSADDILLGYKYGITSDIGRRVSEHLKYSKASGVHFELAYKWTYQKGSTASEHERNLKKAFEGYFLKEELPSGYTESIPIQSLPNLLDMQISQYKEDNYGRID